MTARRKRDQDLPDAAEHAARGFAWRLAVAQIAGDGRPGVEPGVPGTQRGQLGVVRKVIGLVSRVFMIASLEKNQ